MVPPSSSLGNKSTFTCSELMETGWGGSGGAGGQVIINRIEGSQRAQLYMPHTWGQHATEPVSNPKHTTHMKSQLSTPAGNLWLQPKASSPRLPWSQSWIFLRHYFRSMAVPEEGLISLCSTTYTLKWLWVFLDSPGWLPSNSPLSCLTLPSAGHHTWLWNYF